MAALTQAFIAVTTFTASYGLLLYIYRQRRVWKPYRTAAPALTERLLRVGAKLMFVSERKAAEQYERLLRDCGLRLPAHGYVAVKRLFMAAWAASTLGLYAGWEQGTLNWASGTGLTSVMAWIGATMLIAGERRGLRFIAEWRRDKQLLDLIAVSQQLLYFQSASMPLRSKLAKCLPVVTTIRKEWNLLLNEWYEDGRTALERFKRRLGTSEAESFAVTLEAIRMRDAPEFYALLKERMEDQKEQRLLRDDMRRESRSYVLFVLAGFPLLYTFRVFLHPWIQEGQALLNLLNS